MMNGGGGGDDGDDDADHGGNDDDARLDRGPSRSATQNSAQPDNALVSTSTGEASLLPEGDPPESLREQQTIATAHDGQDSTGVSICTRKISPVKRAVTLKWLRGKSKVGESSTVF